MEESRTFAQAVHARLATDILNGELPPGHRLRLQALCETYQVSMSPLREALSNLAGRGLVIQEGQRGFRVAPASADDLRDVTETRVEVETTALRHAIALGGDDWEADIVAAHHRLARRQRTESMLIDENWEQVHRAYHRALIAACGMPRLLAFCEMLHQQSDRYRRLAVLRGGRHPTLIVSHAAIVESTIARDVARATDLLAQHIRESTGQFAALIGESELDALGAPPE